MAYYKSTLVYIFGKPGAKARALAGVGLEVLMPLVEAFPANLSSPTKTRLWQMYGLAI